MRVKRVQTIVEILPHGAKRCKVHYECVDWRAAILVQHKHKTAREARECARR